jgi:hypothetical protein
MKLSDFRLKLQQGVRADWLMDDLTDRYELTLFDCLNLAHCAAARGRQVAGLPGDRFKGEYKTAQCWTAFADDYTW